MGQTCLEPGTLCPAPWADGGSGWTSSQGLLRRSSVTQALAIGRTLTGAATAGPGWTGTRTSGGPEAPSPLQALVKAAGRSSHPLSGGSSAPSWLSDSCNDSVSPVPDSESPFRWAPGTARGSSVWEIRQLADLWRAENSVPKHASTPQAAQTPNWGLIRPRTASLPGPVGGWNLAVQQRVRAGGQGQGGKEVPGPQQCRHHGACCQPHLAPGTGVPPAGGSMCNPTPLEDGGLALVTRWGSQGGRTRPRFRGPCSLGPSLTLQPQRYHASHEREL